MAANTRRFRVTQFFSDWFIEMILFIIESR